MTRLRQSHIHLLGIAFFFVFDFIFYYGKVVAALNVSISLFLFMCAVFSLHIWFFNYLVVYFVRRLFPGLQSNLRKRVITLVFLITLIVFLTSLFQSLFFTVLSSGTNMPAFYVHYEDIGMNLLYSLIIIFFLELIFYFRQWNRAFAEAAELKQKTTESQLESLRNQVSPHFLFNSLNSLSSLIPVSPAKAVSFVQNMAAVYRYLLQAEDKNLITVSEEVKFLQSYLHLLHTRFGSAMHCQIDLDTTGQQCLIPPFTLQLLVENAVKHNVVSAEHPLHIQLYNTTQRLVISNNIQKRTTPVPSTGIGLVNIISKYELLTQAEVEISETADEFIVSLPLLNVKVYEGVDR
jgi:two-component system LytT family sensor kinase